MKISKDEVMRYLGYKNQFVDDKMTGRIEESIDEIKTYIRPRYNYSIFDIEEEPEGVKLKEYDYVLKGEDIKRHLQNCHSCAIMAATLGIDVDNKIRYYEKIDMTKALILDACATAAIEEICDEIECIIKKSAEASCKYITLRYSPGYGDLALEHQDYILRLLEADKRLGLVVNESHILFPRKSVTAIIGFKDDSGIEKQSLCEVCSNFNNCNFSKGGKRCGL